MNVEHELFPVTEAVLLSNHHERAPLMPRLVTSSNSTHRCIMSRCVCLLSACSQDVSKEPIVEVRTEKEATANHDAEGHPEPNETTPLTEPE